VEADWDRSLRVANERSESAKGKSAKFWRFHATPRKGFSRSRTPKPTKAP